MRRFVHLFVLIFLLFPLAGCEATPDYVFPLTDVTDGNARDSNTLGTDSQIDSWDDNDPDAWPDGVTEADPSDPDAPSGITVLSLTDNVSRGSNAFLSIRGTPGIAYQIEVYYSTTISQAKGLEPKTADRDGMVAWSWRVGSKTMAGSHRIVIRGEDGESLTLYFTTTAQS